MTVKCSKVCLAMLFRWPLVQLLSVGMLILFSIISWAVICTQHRKANTKMAVSTEGLISEQQFPFYKEGHVKCVKGHDWKYESDETSSGMIRQPFWWGWRTKLKHSSNNLNNNCTAVWLMMFGSLEDEKRWSGSCLCFMFIREALFCLLLDFLKALWR